MRSAILTLALTALAAGLCNVATAGDCCDKDGGCGGKKVCKLVKTEKEVTVTCWGCKCKDICIPKPGCKGCLETECVDCAAKDGKGCPGNCKVVYSTDVPGCARMRSIKELVKYELKKKVPAYKWELVDAGCCGCDKDADGKTTEVSPPTVTDVTLQDATQVPASSRVAHAEGSLVPAP